MELSSTTLYLIILLGNLELVADMLNSIACGCFFALLIIYAMSEGNLNLLPKYGKLCIVTFCVSIFITCVIPNKKELVAIYFIPQIANSSLAQKIPEGIEKSIDAYLQDQFNLFKEDKKE